MANTDRGRVAIAIVLILIGLLWLAAQYVPVLQTLSFNGGNWPLAVIGVGVILAFAAVVSWTPGLLVPACIVGGIGGLLLWQNATGGWASWAYMWALIPGFVGVGVFLSNVMEGKLREAIRAGGWLVLISLVLYAVFGSVFGGLQTPLGAYWPVLLILLGVLFLVQSLYFRAAPR